MFLFQKVEETTMRYNDARHAVGEFMMQEWKNLHAYTIAEIAERTYTSKPTVTRFAKSMGYDGWREFMKDYIEEVRYENAHSGEIDYNFPFQPTDSPMQIADNIRKVQVESIQESFDLLDEDTLTLAADRLVHARHIVIFAVSPNSYLAELFKRKMISIGYIASVVPHGEAGITAASMTKEDCAVLISYSGNNPGKEPMNKIRILKANDVPMIGITSGGSNYMREHLDCVFTVSTRERLYTKIANYSSEESIEYILNVLFSVAFARNYRDNKNYKVYNARLLEQERNTQINSMRDPE